MAVKSLAEILFPITEKAKQFVSGAGKAIASTITSSPFVNPLVGIAGINLLPKTTGTSTTTTQTQQQQQPPVPKDTNKDEWEEVKPPPKTGGAKTTTSATTSTGTNLDDLILRLTQPSNAYQKAIESEQAMLPLIQQRYKALLDEISASEEAATKKQEFARETQIGETRARASAAGTFPGTTELGTEDIIRKSAADAIATIEATGDVQKAKAIAQQGIDEAQVASEIAKLGISQDQAERSGLKDAIASIIDLQKTSVGESKGTVVQTAEGVMLINPYTGEIISRVGTPKSTGTGQQAITAQLGKDVVANIKSSPVLEKTGTPKAFEVYTKLQVPVIGGAFITGEDAEYKKLQGEFFSLQQAAIKAIQGTRPSDYDAISYAKNVGLSITNSPEANAVAINQLLNLVGGGSLSSTVAQ